ncbi:response regulator transcription factor [Arthrobacter sp. Sr33]
MTGPLTPREFEIVKIVATGMTNTEIAERLFSSERTVENHMSRAMLKVGVTSRTAPGVWHGTQRDNPSRFHSQVVQAAPFGQLLGRSLGSASKWDEWGCGCAV